MSKYLASNGRAYRTRILAQVDGDAIESALMYLRHHGRPATQQAVADLLRSCCDEGMRDLETTVRNTLPEDDL